MLEKPWLTVTITHVCYQEVVCRCISNCLTLFQTPGLLTKHVVEGLETNELAVEVHSMFRRAMKAVAEESKGQQVPVCDHRSRKRSETH